MTKENYDPKKDIEICKEVISLFRDNLPNRVDPASLTWESKIPWKAMALREALLYRITELSESAIYLYEKGNKIISAFIITRAVHETTALFYSFYDKLEKVTTSRILGDFDEFIMRLLFGWKGDPNFPDAFNILTAVDKLDKLIDKFRANYDRLSEFCHPNYSGVFGAYAKINKKTAWADFGSEIRNLSPMIGLHPLVSSFEVFRMFYNKSADIIPVLIKLCEEYEKKGT
jgi:hypothetical protein